MKPVSEWGLTPAQCAAVEAVIQTGSNKGAARLLGSAVATVNAHLCAALEKSGAKDGMGGGRLLMLLAFDRHGRSAA